MTRLIKDFNIYPKFRHNLWVRLEEEKDFYYLTFSKGLYKVPKEDAENFIRIRSFCTGHNTREEIAKKSGFSKEKVAEIVNSLTEVDMLHLPAGELSSVSINQKTETLLDACRIWREQIGETHLLNKILKGEANKFIVQGWLLETYHYIKFFPDTLLAAHNACEHEGLKSLLYKYHKEEKGHEKFIENTLIRTGLTSTEVQSSIPLVSTRLIKFLLEELFKLCPASVLLVASIIEAAEADFEQKNRLMQEFQKHYGFNRDVMEPYFKHVEVDIGLGHEKLLANNLKYLDLIPSELLHEVTNKIHDIKHAFDLQQLEIEYYYKLGNYLPRQFVDFFGI